jgi:hypothetical protein
MDGEDDIIGAGRCGQDRVLDTRYLRVMTNSAVIGSAVVIEKHQYSVSVM